MAKLTESQLTGSMNAESHQVNLVPEPLPWLPASGFQLRKAGVQFDAVRVEGERGRAVADALAKMTGGDPGPVVEEANGNRYVYFLVDVGSTAFRAWPDGVAQLTARPDHVAYIPVPALGGYTWPLSWRYRPTVDGHFVHALLLHTALSA